MSRLSITELARMKTTEELIDFIALLQGNRRSFEGIRDKRRGELEDAAEKCRTLDEQILEAVSELKLRLAPLR